MYMDVAIMILLGRDVILLGRGWRALAEGDRPNERATDHSVLLERSGRRSPMATLTSLKGSVLASSYNYLVGHPDLDAVSNCILVLIPNSQGPSEPRKMVSTWGIDGLS